MGLCGAAEGFEPQIVALAADGESKSIRLARPLAPARIRCVVRVHDAVTHQPVPRFQALVHERVSDTLVQWVHGLRRVEEGREGVVRVGIEGDTPEYDLEVRAEGYLSRRTGWFRRSEGSREVTIALQPAELLVGTVLLPGVYGRGVRATVPPGSTQRVDLALGGGRTEVGRLVGATDLAAIRWTAPGHRFELHGTPAQPVPTGWVERTSRPGSGPVSLEFVPATDGSFRVDAIPDGVYRMEAWLAEETPDGAVVSEVGVVPPCRVARELIVPGASGGGPLPPIDLGVLELVRPAP